MLRLTVFACAAVYAVLVIFSESAPDHGTQTTVSQLDAAPAEAGGGVQSLATADGRSLAVAVVIDPGRFLDRSGQVALIQTPLMAETIMASASRPSPQHVLGEVTGSSVNLRAGPSTGDAVLTSLLRGERVEVIGATGNGWAQIRTVSTGVEGFMAARFLNPLN
jgi:hypothetical protein